METRDIHTPVHHTGNTYSYFHDRHTSIRINNHAHTKRTNNIPSKNRMGLTDTDKMPLTVDTLYG
jgi:hypothetical protein